MMHQEMEPTGTDIPELGLLRPEKAEAVDVSKRSKTWLTWVAAVSLGCLALWSCRWAGSTSSRKPLRSQDLEFSNFESANAQSGSITPGATWVDVNGKPIDAHGASFMLSPLDGRWYMYGETKTALSAYLHGIGCYSSDSLAGPWKFEGEALRNNQIVGLDISGPYLMEKPQVVYSSTTKRFVMWFNLDIVGYGYQHAGIAQSSSPSGPFQFVKGYRPDGAGVFDMTLYQDRFSGITYLFRSVCDWNCDGYQDYSTVSRLSSDLMNSTGIVYRDALFNRMSIFRQNGTYYMLAYPYVGGKQKIMSLYRSVGKSLDAPKWMWLGNPMKESKIRSEVQSAITFAPKSGDPYIISKADGQTGCQDDGEGMCSFLLPVKFPRDGNGSKVEIRWRASWNLDSPFDCHEFNQTHSCFKRILWMKEYSVVNNTPAEAVKAVNDQCQGQCSCSLADFPPGAFKLHVEK
eukprot:TRINITY_DN12221_c0_g1_i2.p1 TRINITY_DN12221_c0_g1~~TRINITY_DN12221_c0_g1_i2.p1  ORF type:complete len:460 (+),score=68.13 TRINITY_DN12221_c0_g1_i2:47-1426(+)